MDKQLLQSWKLVIVPESESMEVLATQLSQSLFSQIFQVVRSFVINHHGQDLPSFHLVYILGQSSALVLAPICVKPTHTHKRKSRSRRLIIDQSRNVTEASKHTEYE